MMAPMILLGILSSHRLSRLVPLATLTALVIFILAKLDIVPSQVWMLEMELILFLGLTLAVLTELTLGRSQKNNDRPKQ